VGPVANENQNELRDFLTFLFIGIRSGIVVVLESWNTGHYLSMCGLIFSTAASKVREGVSFKAVFCFS